MKRKRIPNTTMAVCDFFMSFTPHGVYNSVATPIMRSILSYAFEVLFHSGQGVGFGDWERDVGYVVLDQLPSYKKEEASKT